MTARPSSYFAYDTGLREQVDVSGAVVCDTFSIDPTRLFGKKKTVALPSERVRRSVAMVSQFLFVPDNKVGWIPFAIKAAKRLHRSKPFDVIFASAPPYSSLWAAAVLAKRLSLPLVVDFRDDWLGNPRHIYPTHWHKRLNAAMEYRVLGTAATVVAINRVIGDSLASRSPNPAGVHVLPHGHDVNVRPKQVMRNKMQLLYAGVFYDAQTPDHFLCALAAAVQEHPDMAEHIEARFLGLLPSSSQQLIRRLGLSGMVRYGGYVPHSEALEAQLEADVLWMTIGQRPGAEGISTSKLSEYMGCRKPILALVPQGVARETLEEYKASYIVYPDDCSAIATAIIMLYQDWAHGRLPVPDEACVVACSQHSRTEVLAAHLLTAVHCVSS